MIPKALDICKVLGLNDQCITMMLTTGLSLHKPLMLFAQATCPAKSQINDVKV